MTKNLSAVLVAAFSAVIALAQTTSSEISNNIEETSKNINIVSNSTNEYKENFENDSTTNSFEKYRQSRYFIRRIMPHQLQHFLSEAFSADDNKNSLRYRVLSQNNDRKYKHRFVVDPLLQKPRKEMRNKRLKNKRTNKRPKTNPLLLPYEVADYASNDFGFEEYENGSNIYNKQNLDDDGSYANMDNENDEVWYTKNYQKGEKKDFFDTPTALQPPHNQNSSPFRKYNFDLQLRNALNDADILAKSNIEKKFNRDSFEYAQRDDDFSFLEPPRRNHGVESQPLSAEPVLIHSTYSVQKFTPKLLETNILPIYRKNRHRFKLVNGNRIRNSKYANNLQQMTKFHDNQNFRGRFFTLMKDNSARFKQEHPTENEIDSAQTNHLKNTEQTVYSSRYRKNNFANNILDRHKIATDETPFSSSTIKMDNKMLINQKRNTETSEQMKSFSLKNTTRFSVFSVQPENDSKVANRMKNFESNHLLSNELIAYMRARPTEPLINKEGRFAMTTYPSVKKVSERDHFSKSVMPLVEHDLEIDLDH